MEKKTYTTVAEVAEDLGLNYYALKLLNFLEQYYPEDALYIDYIRGKADDAAAARKKYVLEQALTPCIKLKPTILPMKC
jgi:hypothetical protein